MPAKRVHRSRLVDFDSTVSTVNRHITEITYNVEQLFCSVKEQLGGWHAHSSADVTFSTWQEMQAVQLLLNQFANLAAVATELCSCFAGDYLQVSRELVHSRSCDMSRVQCTLKQGLNTAIALFTALVPCTPVLCSRRTIQRRMHISKEFQPDSSRVRHPNQQHRRDTVIHHDKTQPCSPAVQTDPAKLQQAADAFRCIYCNCLRALMMRKHEQFVLLTAPAVPKAETDQALSPAGPIRATAPKRRWPLKH